MRANLPATALAACFLFLACTPAQPAQSPNTQSRAAASPTAAQPTAEPASEPASLTTASSDPAPSASLPLVPDLADSPGDAQLENAAALLRAGDPSKARFELENKLPDLDKSAGLDTKLAAHALLGRACGALGDDKCAAEQSDIVRTAWKDPAAAVKDLDGAGGDAKAKAGRRARALDAVGEALFYAAEEKKRAAEKERVPSYAGGGDKASIMSHLSAKIAPWVKARRALIEDANKSYSEIAKLQPSAPPRWVVAASARAGMMWGRFVAEFRASPIPKDWNGTGPLPGTTMTREEARSAFYAALDEASKPQRAMARSAFKTCQDLSRKLGVVNDYSKHCDTWLAKSIP